MQPYPAPFAPWAWRDGAGLTGEPGVSELEVSELDDGRVDAADQDVLANADLTGYKVEATDGHIGSIDEASYDVGTAYVVVDTGPWIFGRKVLLPAGTIERVDHADKRVYVDRTKDQIKSSPEYDKDTFSTDEYRQQVGDYYTGTYS